MQAKWWRSGFFYLLLLVVIVTLIFAFMPGEGPEYIDKIGLFIEKVKDPEAQIDTIQQDGDTLIALKDGEATYKTGCGNCLKAKG
jgi:hypothetical protein